MRRGRGVEPLAPAIGELHVRQILIVISFTLLDIISGLCVDEIRQRPLSDGFPIRLAAEAGLSSNRGVDVRRRQRHIRGAGLEIHNVTWIELLTQLLARQARSKVCRWTVRRSRTQAKSRLLGGERSAGPFQVAERRASKGLQTISDSISITHSLMQNRGMESVGDHAH